MSKQAPHRQLKVISNNLSDEDQEKLLALLSSGNLKTLSKKEILENKISPKEKEAQDKRILSHVHNEICKDFDDKYRSYIGACGYKESSLWTEKKNKVFSLFGRQCKVCDSTQRVVAYNIAGKRINGEIPEIDLIPLCEQHAYECELYWRTSASLTFENKQILSDILQAQYGERAKDEFRKQVLFVWINDTQSMIHKIMFEEEKNTLEESQARQLEILTEHNKALLNNRSPNQLRTMLNKTEFELKERAKLLNISIDNFEQNLDPMDFARLRQSFQLYSNFPTTIPSFPITQNCIVCSNQLFDDNVVYNYFDSYLCAGKTNPNWDLATTHKDCWYYHPSTKEKSWKQGFPSLTAAEDNIIFLAERRNESPDVYYTYLCENCGRWHFGHRQSKNRTH